MPDADDLLTSQNHSPNWHFIQCRGLLRLIQSEPHGALVAFWRPFAHIGGSRLKSGPYETVEYSSLTIQGQQKGLISGLYRRDFERSEQLIKFGDRPNPDEPDMVPMGICHRAHQASSTAVMDGQDPREEGVPLVPEL